ncbi:hypothetical protein QPJ18_001421 [Escherichia coli]|nr:hypothetical protein [Escherichia coli]
MTSNPTFILIAITVIVTISSILFLTYLLNDVIKEIWKKRFEKSIRNGIKNNKIENNDIYILADRWPIGKTNIQHCLNMTLDYYINTDDQDKAKLIRLREIISWHKKQDPFSELPENIKLQLITLQNISDKHSNLILHLSISLSELYISKEKKARSEKLISRGSLIVGIIGTAFTIMSQYIH